MMHDKFFSGVTSEASLAARKMTFCINKYTKHNNIDYK